MLWFLLSQNVPFDVKPIHLRVLNLTANTYVNDTLLTEVVTFTPDGNIRVIDTVEIYGMGDTYVPPSVHVLAFNVMYRGEVFPSRVVVVGKDTVMDIFVYDVTYDSSVIKLTSENIGLLRDRGGYRVVEVFFVFNNSKYAYRGPSVRIKVPEGATALSMSTGDDDVIRKDGWVILNPLILPGEGNFALSYVVVKEDFGVERSGADNYKLLADTLVPVRVKYATYRGTEEFEGEKIRVWEGSGRIAFYVGTPPVKKELLYYTMGAVFVLVIVGIVFVSYYGIRAFRRGRPS